MVLASLAFGRAWSLGSNELLLILGAQKSSAGQKGIEAVKRESFLRLRNRFCPLRLVRRYIDAGFGFMLRCAHVRRHAEHRYARPGENGECGTMPPQGFTGAFYSDHQHTWLILRDRFIDRIARPSVFHDEPHREVAVTLNPELLSGDAIGLRNATASSDRRACTAPACGEKSLRGSWPSLRPPQPLRCAPSPASPVRRAPGGMLRR